MAETTPANVNYGAEAATNEWAKNAAFAIEQMMATAWTQTQARAHPVFAIMTEGKKAVHYGKISGNSRTALIPVIASDSEVQAAGCPRASQSTAMTPNETAGFSQAEYQIAHYRHNYTLNASEVKLLREGSRGNILEGKHVQLSESFANVIASHISSSTIGSEQRAQGIYHVLSTSNTVGGIPQSSVANWQSNVQTSAGTLTSPAIFNMIDAITPKLGKVDLMIASYSGVNVFGKIRSMVLPNQRLVNTDVAKYGFRTYSFEGADVVLDHHAPSGTLAFLDTSTWYVLGDKHPTPFAPLTPQQLATAWAQVYQFWISLGCSAPGRNGLISGITG